MERSISQMEYETNSIKFPDIKVKLLSSLDNNKEKYENLKKEISCEKKNEIPFQTQRHISPPQTNKITKTEIFIEIPSKKKNDENENKEYTIKKVGLFTYIFYQMRSLLSKKEKKYFLIIFAFFGIFCIFIFFAYNFKIKCINK